MTVCICNGEGNKCYGDDDDAAQWMGLGDWDDRCWNEVRQSVGRQVDWCHFCGGDTCRDRNEGWWLDEGKKYSKELV